MATKILVFLINYKSDEDTIRIVRQLFSLPSSEFLHICVVNNSQTGQSLQNLRKEYSDQTFSMKDYPNLGYFGGAQRALVEWKKEHPNIPLFTIISNVDLEIQDKEFFTQLLSTSMSDLIGAIGPSIFSGIALQDANPLMVHRPTARKMLFYRWIFSHWISCQIYQLLGLFKAKLKSFLPRGKKNQSPMSSTVQDVYAINGAMMIFTANYFLKGNDFTHPAFLYGEEMTVAEKCRRSGLIVQHHPALKVYHREHGSTGMFYSRQTLSFFKESSLAIFKNYFSED